MSVRTFLPRALQLLIINSHMFAIKVASWFKSPETQKTATLFDSCFVCFCLRGFLAKKKISF